MRQCKALRIRRAPHLSPNTSRAIGAILAALVGRTVDNEEYAGAGYHPGITIAPVGDLYPLLFQQDLLGFFHLLGRRLKPELVEDALVDQVAGEG